MDDACEPQGLWFDAVAHRYDHVRPRYPSAMFEDISVLTGLPCGASVLEVGCGTGQATGGLLQHGWRVRATEPGAAMAALAAQNFAGEPFTVHVMRFEEWDPDAGTFAMLFSATAFHWVDPSVRWIKAASVLKPGGFLALATNRTVQGGSFDQLYEASAELHEAYGLGTGDGPSPEEEQLTRALRSHVPDIATVWATAEPKAGKTEAGPAFMEPHVRWYPWQARYNAAEVARLLSTYSPYLRLSPEPREALLAGIERLVGERFDGEVTRRYLTVLAVAERT